jgi:hypothetical protein
MLRHKELIKEATVRLHHLATPFKEFVEKKIKSVNSKP